MNAGIEAASLLGTLEKQLRLLHELSSELVASRAAYVKMDLDAIYQHIAVQTALCDQLHHLEEERKVAWRAACTASGLDPEAGDIRALIGTLEPDGRARMRDAVTKLALAEGELRHLNRAHTVLVEGSRRTLAILGNVLASFAPTYSRPTGSSSSTAPLESTAQQ